MTEFEAKCPHCGAGLKMQDEWVGLVAECPSCKQHFTIAPLSEPQSSAADAAEQKAAESRPSAESPSSKLPEFESSFGSPSPGGQQSEKSESKFLFTCPNCGRKIKALESWHGRMAECPYCQKTFTIPVRQREALEAEPVSPPSPGSAEKAAGRFLVRCGLLILVIAAVLIAKSPGGCHGSVSSSVAHMRKAEVMERIIRKYSGVFPEEQIRAYLEGGDSAAATSLALTAAKKGYAAEFMADAKVYYQAE